MMMAPQRQVSTILKRLFTTLAIALLLIVGFGIVLAYESDIPAAELEARYADSTSQFIEVVGSRIHFKDEGSPDLPALLLVHGTASSLHTWDAWADELREEFRILRLDLPGYGLTGPNRNGEAGRGNYSIAYRIEVIEALLQERGVDRVAVAGNSLGGLIAWRYAAAHPERVAAAILVNAAGAPRPKAQKIEAKDSGFRVIDLVSMPVINDLLTRLTPRFLIRDALHQVYADPSKVNEKLIDRHHAMLLREGNRRAMVEAATQRTLEPPAPASIGSTMALGELDQPMLIMWGRQDSWIPVADAELFHAELAHSEVVIYNDAGHVPMEEIPVRSAADALDFLKRRYGAPIESAESSPVHAVVRQKS